MERQENIQLIMNDITCMFDADENFGKILNYLQDIAEECFSEKAFKRYLINSSRDASECEDLDGILLCGDYYDWKEYDYRRNTIIRSWLKYFNENELETLRKGVNANYEKTRQRIH